MELLYAVYWDAELVSYMAGRWEAISVEMLVDLLALTKAACLASKQVEEKVQ